MKYSTVVFLYAYLVQVYLSLDRSRWTPIIDLREYYKTRISPGKVAQFLLDSSGLNPERIHYLYFLKAAGFFEKIRNMIRLRLCHASYLTKDEI